MPVYEVSAPNGRVYEVEGPANASNAQLISTLQQYLATQPAPKKGLLAAGERGLESLISTGRTALGAAFGSPEEAAQAAKAGIERGRAIGEKYVEPTSLERVKQAYAEKGLLAAGKEAIGQVPGAIVEQAPQLGAMAGGARLGATAGSLFGPVGAVVGGFAGAAVPSLIQQFGSNVERQAAEQQAAGQPVDISRGAAATAAVPQAALDVAGSFIPFGGKLISKVTGIPTGALFGKTAAQAEKLANERLLTTLTKGTAVGAAAEIPTEIAQQMLERAQAGLSLSSPEAMKEYGATAYSVGLLAPLGAAGRVSEKAGARGEIAATKQAEQVKAAEAAKVQAETAAAEEAKRKASPEYLLQLDQQHAAALTTFNEAKKAVGKKPGKEADDDAKDAYKERLTAAKEAEAAYKAIREEYKPVRPAIAQAKEEARVAGMSPQDYMLEGMGLGEAIPAPEYRTLADLQEPVQIKTPPAPVPQALLPNVQQTMDQLQAARPVLDTLKEQARDAAAKGDTAAINALAQQHQAAKTKLEELEALVKEQGGVTQTPETFEATATSTLATLDTKIKNAQKKLADAGELGEIEALPKLAAKLDALKEERTTVGAELGRQREVLRVNAVPVGETIPLTADEVRPKTTEVIRPEEAGAGPLRPEKQRRMMKAMQPDMFRSSEEEIERQKKIRKYKETPVGEQIPLFGPKLLPKQPEAVRPVEVGAGPLPKEKGKAPEITLDLFSDFNLLNTALNDRNPQVLAAMQRSQEIADRKAVAALTSKLTPREAVYDALKDRIDGIVRRERNYDTYEYTDQEGTKREVYVTDEAAKQIKALRDKVEKPVTDKNGVVKRSMLQIAHDQFAKLEQQNQLLDEAKAAKAPAERIAALKTKVEKAKTAYEATLKRIAPERAKLDAAMAKLYKTTVVQTPGQKEAELQALGRSKRSVSRTAKTAARINAGDVRKEAEASTQLKELASDIGAETDEYKKAYATNAKQYQALKEKLGADDKRVSAFLDKTRADMEELAVKLGKKSPEYKAVLKEQIAQYTASVATAGTQVEKSKRTPQATRKVAKLGVMPTGTAESKERTAKANERMKREFEQAAATEKEGPVYRAKAEAGRGMDKAEVEKLVADYTKNWKRGPNVVVTESPREAGNASGALSRDGKTLFVYYNNVRDAADTEATVFHEGLGHFGLRDMFKQKLDGVLNAMYKTNKDMRDAADAWLKDNPESYTEAGEDRTARAVEEVLAIHSEAGTKYASLWARVKALVKAFARRMGLPDLAYTNEELDAIIAQAHGRVMETGELGGALISEAPVVYKVGAKNKKETNSLGLRIADSVEKINNFWKWFKNSVAVDDKGNPLVVYHGTHSDYEVFSSEKGLSSKAFYFTTDKAYANAYASGENGRIVPAYLSMQNPLILGMEVPKSGIKKVVFDLLKVIPYVRRMATAITSVTESVGLTDEVITELKSLGYDGVINPASQHYIVFDNTQIKSAVSNSGEFSPSNPSVVYRAKTKYADDDLSKLSDTIIAQPKSFAEKAGKFYGTELEMQTTDMRAGLRRALEAGAKALGDTKLFTQAMFSVTKADQKMSVVQAALANGPMRTYTDAKGLKGIKSNNQGGAKEIFEAMSEIPDRYGDESAKVGITSTYLIARRAMNKGLSKLDIGALGVTEEQLAAAMRVVQNDPALEAALEKTRKLYNTYNKGLINGLAETGTITKAQAASFLKDEDYVPFYRVRDNGMAELVFGGEKIITIGDIRQQPYLAELKGGETKILPLNESLQRNTLLLTDKMITNMAQRNVAYALQAYGAEQKVMKVQKGKGPAGPDIIRFMQEPKEGDRNDTGDRWLRVETNETVLDGIPAQMIVKSLDGAHLTLPAFLKWGSAAGDLLRSGVTRTPLYLMRQLFRDPMAASFTSGLDYGPLRAIYKANKAFLDLSRGQSETGAKLIEKGLIQSGIFTGDPDDMAKFSLQLASGKSQGAIDKLFALMDRAAMNADAATRTLVYDNAIKNGLSEVEADFATMESMNFHKRGLSPTVQYASRMIPFFNAQIQGLNVLYKAARGRMPFEEQLKIKKKFVNNAVMLMGMGMVYAMAMEDDEYYKNAKPKDRYSNFFVHIPGVEEPIKLPIPYEAGWFFSMAVATVDAMKDTVDSEQQFNALKDMVIGAVPGSSSMLVPQIVKPVAEVWTNKSFFFKTPLESARLQRLDPEKRYNANTTEVAKYMSSLAGGALSPIQIEHLVSGYMGQLPIAAMAAANGLFTSAQSVELPAGRASDLPVVGSAFQRKQGGDEADVAYRIAGEALQAKATYSELAGSGKKEEAKEYLAEHKPEIAAAQAAGAFTQIMGDLRKQEVLIRGKNIGAEEKRARLDKLEDIRQKQAERFVKVLKKIEADVEKRTPQ